LNHSLGLYYLKIERPRDPEKAIKYFERCKEIDEYNSIDSELNELIKEAESYLN
jgi:hypothetical protein